LALSLFEQGNKKEAGVLTTRIPASEQDSLEPDLRGRLADLKARVDQGDIFRESDIDAILSKPSYTVFSTGVIRSSTEWFPSLDYELLLGSTKSPLSFASQGSLQRATESNVTSGYGSLGLDYRLGDYRMRGLYGYRTGGKYLNHQVFAFVRGPLAMIDYASLTFELARALGETAPLAGNGVSETRLEFYFDWRPARWVTMSATSTLRWTHLGSLRNQGNGEEFTAKIRLGDRTWRLHFGPWGQLVRWRTSSPILLPLLVSRSSVLGIFASWDWGRTKTLGWGGNFSAGWGADFSIDIDRYEIGFFEGYVEKGLAKGLSLKWVYQLYSSGFNKTTNSATHIGRVALYKEL